MHTSALERNTHGLDFVRGIIRKEVGAVPIAETLRFEVIDAQPGRVWLNGAPDSNCYNLIGTIHGGWVAAILDTAMGLAVLSQLEPDLAFTTIELKVSYLRAITPATGPVHAEGHVVNAGRRVAFSEAHLVDGNGKALARASSSCLIVPAVRKAA